MRTKILIALTLAMLVAVLLAAPALADQCSPWVWNWYKVGGGWLWQYHQWCWSPGQGWFQNWGAWGWW